MDTPFEIPQGTTREEMKIRKNFIKDLMLIRKITPNPLKGALEKQGYSNRHKS